MRRRPGVEFILRLRHLARQSAELRQATAALMRARTVADTAAAH
jgi:hypothetical protein